MEIILGKTAGFCYGVKNAVIHTEEELEKYKDISCLGELVHNGQVINKLEKLGLKVVEKIEDANNKVIIRAHGVEKEIYNKAKKLNLEVLDFTCPNVLKIHKMADEYAKKGYFIILIGNKKHPETIGTISFCGKNSYLIEEKNEVEKAISVLKKSKIEKVLLIVQTTFSLEKFENIVEDVKKSIDKNIILEIRNTICNATKIRQEETLKMATKVECMVIIGGKNSSNTQKLYNIAKENCFNVFLVETKDELEIQEIKKFNVIGIMAGASTPSKSIEDVIKELQK